VTTALAINFITSRLNLGRRDTWLALLRQEVRAIEASLAVPSSPNRSHRHGES
jgi:hypothetical protein